MATYKKAKYQLVASTIQMTVLLQFNRVDKYTVKDLSKAVGCDCSEFFLWFEYYLNIFRISFS